MAGENLLYYFQFRISFSAYFVTAPGSLAGNSSATVSHLRHSVSAQWTYTSETQ